VSRATECPGGRLSARPRHSRPLLVLGLVLGIGLLSATGASAKIAHPYTGESFGPGGLGSGAFTKVQALAVDDTGGGTDGDVYVYDQGAESLYRFDAAGHPADFTAGPGEGTNAITAISGSSGNGELEIAVSPAGANAGDIYLARGFLDVLIYDAAGETKGELALGEAPGVGSEICGVATDAAGDVYTGVYGGGDEGKVNKYSPTGQYVASLWDLHEVCNIAADSSGDVYVDSWKEGPVTRYAPSQFITEAEFISGGSQPSVGTEVSPAGSTLAVDRANDDLYVDEQDTVVQYSAPGTRLGSSADTEPGAVTGSFGVAVGPGGNLYASDNSSGVVRAYGPGLVLPPRIETESVTGVSSSAATLNAEINPNGIGAAYYFEYGTDDCSNPASPCAAIPDRSGIDIGAGETDQSVAVPIVGLAPGTVYHYRVVAVDIATEELIDGPDQTFTTQEIAGPLQLPDGRAWEMVSPLDKNGGDILGINGIPGAGSGGVVQAAADGDALTYLSSASFADGASAPSSSQYFSTRGSAGWSVENINPPMLDGTFVAATQGGPYKAFAEDLSSGLLVNGGGGVPARPVRNPPLPGTAAPPGYENFYFHDNQSGSYSSLLSAAPEESSSEFELSLVGSTPDLAHPVFSTPASLTPPGSTPGSRASQNLYEWIDGRLQLINLLPGETVGTPGAELAAHDADGRQSAISPDGSRVYFTEGGPSGPVYLREGIGTADAQTVPVSGGTFQLSSADGSTAFLVGPGGEGDLYRYDAETRQSTDITPSAEPGGARVQGVLGTSADGSYVYFVADGVLAEGASPGQCVTSILEGGPQHCNLYLWHAGQTRFVATLTQDDNSQAQKSNPETSGAADDWSPELSNLTARVSPDGSHLLFMSDSPLTGYDSEPSGGGSCEPHIVGGRRCQEVYLYDATAGSEGDLTCVSCNPTGARPLGLSSIPGGTPFGNTKGTSTSHGFSWTAAGASSSKARTPSCPRTPTAPRTSTSGRRTASAPAIRGRVVSP
jgi:hypothetical protein